MGHINNNKVLSTRNKLVLSTMLSITNDSQLVMVMQKMRCILINKRMQRMRCILISKNLEISLGKTTKCSRIKSTDSSRINSSSKCAGQSKLSSS